jgi:hypothetical protein
MPNHQPPFRERLHVQLCRAYKHGGLARLLRFALNVAQKDIVGDVGFEQTAFEVAEWAEDSDRLEDLLVYAAGPGRPRYKAFEQLLAEYRTGSVPAPAVPGGAGGSSMPASGSAVGSAPAVPGGAGLPDGLPDAIDRLNKIPKVIRNTSECFAAMAAAADHARLLLADHGLPESFYSSPRAGERLAAILALAQVPNPGFLRWLAERPAVELPYAGYAAAVALTEAAVALPVAALDRVERAAAEGERLRRQRKKAAEQEACRQELDESRKAVGRRLGRVAPDVDLLFETFFQALIEFKTRERLDAILRVGGRSLGQFVRPDRGVAYCCFAVLDTASRARWDYSLAQSACTSWPDSVKLEEVAAAYRKAGRVPTEEVGR